MKKPIEIWSKQMAENWKLDYPYAHISIYSPGSKKAVLSDDSNRVDTLFLEFDDVTYEQWYRETDNYHAFNWS